MIDENAFAGGKFVTKFEEEYAKFCETKFCVGVANGTDALTLALRAYGLESVRVLDGGFPAWEAEGRPVSANRASSA